MPYISATDQAKLAELTGKIVSTPINAAGDLNFLITQLLIQYMAGHEHRYQAMNDVVGALTSAQVEFIRRVVTPYENKKKNKKPKNNKQNH
jgi:hypothetical protein